MRPAIEVWREAWRVGHDPAWEPAKGAAVIEAGRAAALERARAAQAEAGAEDEDEDEEGDA